MRIGRYWAALIAVVVVGLGTGLMLFCLPALRAGAAIFAVGALVLGWFVLGLRTGWSLRSHGAVEAGSTEVREPPDTSPERA